MVPSEKILYPNLVYQGLDGASHLTPVGEQLLQPFMEQCHKNETYMSVLDNYQTLASRTISKDMSQHEMLLHSALGLASEAGELAGIYQKTYQGHDLAQQHEHIIKELGDCLWMIAEHCTALGIPLALVAQTNIEKLEKRYPDGFDPERSLHREEGDI